MRRPSTPELFAPLARSLAVVMVLGGFVVVPQIIAREDTRQGDIAPVTVVSLSGRDAVQPEAVMRRIDQGWRVEIALRRGDVQVANAYR